MLNASVGVQRVIGRVRRSSSQESTRVVSTPTRIRVSHPTRDPMASTHLYHRSQATPQHLRAACLGDPRHLAMPRLAIPRHLSIRTTLRRLGHERTTAVAVAGIVLAASFLSVSPGRPSGDTGGPTGDGPGPRLAIGGPVGDGGTEYGNVVSSYEEDPADETTDAAAARPAAADDAAVVEIPLRLEHVNDGAAVTSGPRCPHDRRGTVPRRRHPAQARRGQHQRPGRQRPHPHVQGQGRRHARRHRQEVRRDDDDAVVGQQAQGEERPRARPGARDPAGHRSRRRGQVDRHARLARSSLQGRRDRDPHDEPDRRPQPRRRPGARPAGCEGRPDQDPEAQAEGHLAACRAQRRQLGRRHGQPRTGASAQDLLRRQLRLARTRRPHQPVLPLRPLRDRHRRQHGRPHRRRGVAAR